jgi:heme exporter protein D
MTMTFAQEAGFIVAAYAMTLFVIAALIAWVVLDYSSQRRVLGEMEEQGVTRRSRRGQGSSA